MSKNTALLLSGGGARAAYQAGVLKAVNELLNQPDESPFQIVTGTSAGAINSCAIASNNHQFSQGVERLENVWAHFSPDKVYKTNLSSLTKNAIRWGWNLIRPKEQTSKPLALLNNSPLKTFLAQLIRFDDINSNIEKGNLHAACCTAYNYNTGDSVSFFQGNNKLREWKRFRRHGKRDVLTIEHLLASSAIPMVFPSEPIKDVYFGDGSMRFLAPLSPAVHLGARKLFVITVDPIGGEIQHHIKVPSIGDISGHLLDSIFIDSLESDIERLRRINHLLEHIPEADAIKKKLTLKPIDALIISPSIDLEELAGKYFKELPRGLRFFFKRIGIDHENGESILSYLLFHSSYTQELIQLGYQDAMEQRKDIKEFFLTS